jgi:hypothetical protein
VFVSNGTMAATYVANILHLFALSNSLAFQPPVFYVNAVCGILNGMQISWGSSEVADRYQ